MTKDSSNVLNEEDFEKLYELFNSYLTKINDECLMVMKGKKISLCGQQKYLFNFSKTLCEFTMKYTAECSRVFIDNNKDYLKINYDPNDSSHPINCILDAVIKNFSKIKEILKAEFCEGESINKC